MTRQNPEAQRRGQCDQRRHDQYGGAVAAQIGRDAAGDDFLNELGIHPGPGKEQVEPIQETAKMTAMFNNSVRRIELAGGA